MVPSRAPQRIIKSWLVPPTTIRTRVRVDLRIGLCRLLRWKGETLAIVKMRGLMIRRSLAVVRGLTLRRGLVILRDPMLRRSLMIVRGLMLLRSPVVRYGGAASQPNGLCGLMDSPIWRQLVAMTRRF